MAITTIVDFYEVLEYLQSFTALDEDKEAALASIHKHTERQITRYLGYVILQPSAAQTVFLPEANMWDAHWQREGIGDAGSVLRLPDVPVRSVTSVHEDAGAYAGSATNAWASADELTEGDDFFIDEDFSGFSSSGYLVRTGGTWPAYPRSVRVIYLYGYTAAELKGDVTDARLDASDIRAAILQATGEAYNISLEVKERSGPLQAEKLGDYGVTYASVDITKRFGKSGLSQTVREILDPFKRKGAMVW